MLSKKNKKLYTLQKNIQKGRIMQNEKRVNCSNLFDFVKKIWYFIINNKKWREKYVKWWNM